MKLIWVESDKKTIKDIKCIDWMFLPSETWWRENTPDYVLVSDDELSEMNSIEVLTDVKDKRYAGNRWKRGLISRWAERCDLIPEDEVTMRIEV